MTVQRPYIIKTARLVKKYSSERHKDVLAYETHETEIYAFNLKDALECFETYLLIDKEILLSIKLRNEEVYDEI
ncbi:hypothetical protein [Enterococcus phage vB_EfaP_Efmus3]|uniref:Uncharacterized protein n=1 Tax=Enterococcus phage vB_EfaP_Efmus3 TaxID=2546623 RepID=A0A4D6DRW7_9CAUD|nr:hypothetical protein H3T69_gp07 [Enterococcus phage vB_EfaP_Efmus3]QBZ69085.1 hypothetical protein [Enterococcus phage vB_EfaP_Efmus3]